MRVDQKKRPADCRPSARASLILELWAIVAAASAKPGSEVVADSVVGMPAGLGTAEFVIADLQDRLTAYPGLKLLPQLAHRRRPSARGDSADVRMGWRCWQRDRSGRIPGR